MSDDPTQECESGPALREAEDRPGARATVTDPHLLRRQAPEPSADSPVFTAGELVGGVYELREELGSGGMGQVFEAYDRVLERRVAIKVAWFQHVRPLWEEARALAAFRHPSLPTVYTFGTHKGVDYLVMERIYGVSLKADLDRRRESGEMLTLTEALDLVIAIAEGLAVVHRAGLAHRDVKPSNVMLTPDRRMVLMDFGLVLPEFAMSSRPAAAGSPPYMAPEALTNAVAAGQGHLVDVYSLGAVAFELLVGRPPRRGITLHEVIQEHRHDHIPSVGRLCAGLPERLSMLIDEMLASDPETRPQSAEGIVWQLKSIQERDVRVRKRGPSDVLVVEDDKDVARVLEFYVKQELGNAAVRVAKDGEDALRSIRERAPDVLLLDLHLPHLNGIELCMYMRGEGIGHECTIIPVTASAEDHDRQLLHQLGIHHFVHKTAGLKEELKRTLRQVAGMSGATG